VAAREHGRRDEYERYARHCLELVRIATKGGIQWVGSSHFYMGSQPISSSS